MKSARQTKTVVSVINPRLLAGLMSILVVVSMILAAGNINLASAAEPSAAQKSKILTEGGYEKLAAQAARNGSVRIIVKVEASFTPMGDLSATEADAQVSRIARAQDKVMAQLASVNVISHYKYTYIPHIAMTVDKNALDAVLAIAEVSSVEEDALASAKQVNWDITKVGAPTAWASGYDGTGYAVAVLDTGVDSTHPLLTGKVVSEACYSSNYSSSSASSVCPGGVTDSTASGSAMPYAGNCPTGECDHGTHVAGTAAGLNTGQSSGVAKGANIIAIQVFTRFDSTSTCSPDSSCVLTYASDQLKGLERVYALRSTYSIASVNMSLGGSKYTANCDTDSRKTAIDNLRSAGIATVISSGNSGYTDGMGAPGCISTAVSVGATDSSDLVASYSNSASFLHLLAPGSSILSSIPNGGYATWNGTSMAAPHVAGAWAVLKQVKPSASVTDILSALTTTGVSVTDTRNNITKPRIQVDAAVTALNSNSSDLAAATAKITEIYNKHATYFGTASGGVTTGTASGGGTYYIQRYVNGTALLAYPTGYMYWYDGAKWYSSTIQWK